MAIIGQNVLYKTTAVSIIYILLNYSNSLMLYIVLRMGVFKNTKKTAHSISSAWSKIKKKLHNICCFKLEVNIIYEHRNAVNNRNKLKKEEKILNVTGTNCLGQCSQTQHQHLCIPNIYTTAISCPLHCLSVSK